MRHALHLRATPVHRETIHSFFGRMAAVNGTDSANFASNFGLQFKNLLSLRKDAVEVLRGLSGISPERIEETVSWTGRPSTEGRMTYRGEEHAVRSLRTSTGRGCPKCLRADTKGSDDAWEELMAVRGDRLLRGVRTCRRHAHPLVDLWTEKAASERYDVQNRMREIGRAVRAGELDRPEVAITTYDTWLEHVSRMGRTIPIRAVTMFCDLLGDQLLRKGIVEKKDGVPSWPDSRW